MWRVHAVWSLDDERFSCFELTDEKEGERLDRATVIPAWLCHASHGREIRIAATPY